MLPLDVAVSDEERWGPCLLLPLVISPAPSPVGWCFPRQLRSLVRVYRDLMASAECRAAEAVGAGDAAVVGAAPHVDGNFLFFRGEPLVP